MLGEPVHLFSPLLSGLMKTSLYLFLYFAWILQPSCFLFNTYPSSISGDWRCPTMFNTAKSVWLLAQGSLFWGSDECVHCVIVSQVVRRRGTRSVAGIVQVWDRWSASRVPMCSSCSLATTVNISNSSLTYVHHMQSSYAFFKYLFHCIIVS